MRHDIVGTGLLCGRCNHVELQRLVYWAVGLSESAPAKG